MTHDHDVPPDLAGLELFARDESLCERWPDLKARWQRLYPELNIMHELRESHAWQMEEPPSGRKKVQSRFIFNWLKRSHKAVQARQRQEAATEQRSFAKRLEREIRQEKEADDG